MTKTNSWKNIDPSEITPKNLYLSRRAFMRAAGVAAGGALLAACAPSLTPTPAPTSEATEFGPTPTYIRTHYQDELGNFSSKPDDIKNYNNYYEFTTRPQGVAELAKNFPTSPWDVEVYGMVENPGTFSVEELVKRYPPEERIYRLRCVEAWSLVIPWIGFPLARLLEDVKPTAEAKYVRFESVFKPDEMPGQKQSTYPWPYQEGLRLDEAMHDLTLLATGLYGGDLPPQNGGGIRLVVPWKYGFKSIKAVVKIELVSEQPDTLWNTIAPNEYGFYSNVNPEVNHPRWSQSSERRIGETHRRPTLMFNGYEDQVAHLYEGMDLKEYY